MGRGGVGGVGCGGVGVEGWGCGGAWIVRFYFIKNTVDFCISVS